eukprot:CAMPEP_0198526472 /NCGR_PEP_ID=MMETSP1462-20131121/23981_1 /TAXON_ID=1333877 /ORGANISM="Brandtodinium nutriculum, Strain RCC3387" /LENGTH=183 /DNA_ID=CAMNT_0044256249 /DNA_START=88 /DNA_END=635 /DNA_ORIENTATION=+
MRPKMSCNARKAAGSQAVTDLAAAEIAELARRRQRQTGGHGPVLLPRALFGDLVGVDRAAPRSRTHDIRRHMVEEPIVPRLRPAASSLIREGERWRGAADQLGPQTADAARWGVPVAHRDRAALRCGAAHSRHRVVPLLDPRVRRVDGDDAEAGALPHWRGRHHARHGERAGVPIAAEAAPAG